MPHLHIQLLGGFRLTGSAPSEVRTGRLQALLVYLLLHRHTPQPRRHIAFLFWPDSTEKQALSNLRTLYARLRHALGNADPFLSADRETIHWLPDGPFALDVAEFEAAVAGAGTVTEWQAVMRRYHGPLLPGWYEEWLEPERARLEQLFFHAGETLMDLLEAHQRYGDAIQTAQQLLQHDPLREATYRRLMHLQLLAGAKADAVRTYHSCATHLQDELGVEPDEATRRLYDQLLHGETEPPPGPASEPETAEAPLIGRDQEMSRLKKTWHATNSGRARAVLISGEAGVGKSRLAREFLRWAQRAGIATVSARSYQAEGELAYAPVLTWLRSPVLRRSPKQLDDVTLSELARLLPELLVERLDLPAPVPLTEAWQRRRLFEALARATTVQARPLLLHIDDLHWCDQETLEWLHYLLRFDAPAPLMLVGAYRPEEVGAEHPLAALQLALLQSRQLTLLELERLPSPETSALAAQLMGHALTAEAARQLYRETEGNPLFVVEIMRSGLADEEQPDALPAGVQAMIQGRLTRLTSQARELAAQAAVIGRDFDYDLLARTSGMPEDVLVGGLDELWRRRIIREHGGAEYDFSHDKIREVAYGDLSQTRRRMLHRRIAEALEARHASHLDAYSAQIATHYEKAGMAREAIPHYERAAETSHHLYAHGEAIRAIQRALRLLRSLPAGTSDSWLLPTQARLFEHLGDLLHFTARYEEAQHAFEAAFAALEGFAEAQPVSRCRLLRKAGSSLLEQHQYTAALQLYERARDVLGEEPTREAVAWWREWIDLQQERKYVYYWLNRWAEISEIIEDSRPILTQYGTAAQRALFFDPSMFLRRDRFVISDAVLGYAREWHAALLQLDDPVREAAAHFMLGFVLLWYGALGEAEAEMRVALEQTDQTGDINLRARCLTYLAIVYRKQGQLQAVRRTAKDGRQAAREAAMPEYIATAEANLAWVAWRQGDSALAQELGRSAEELWQTLPSGHASCAFQWTARFPLIAISLAEERLSDAVRHAQALLDPAQQVLPGELSAVLENAVHTYVHEQPVAAATLLRQAITLAGQMRFL